MSVANRLRIDNYYFFKHQLFFILLSVFITIFISFLNEKTAKKSVIVLFSVSLVLLIMVHFIGFQTKGSRRWLHFFGFSIQPTELIKPSFVLISAYLLDKFQKTENKKYFVINAILYAVCVYFTYTQPDIGTLVLLTSIFFIQIFLLKFINIKYCFYMFLFMTTIIITSYLTLSHVNSRINNFLASMREPEKVNYQVKRSMNAYNNSNLLGKGFMEGKVKNFIPDVHTDFIFPAITEEFGFCFAFLIISLYFYITIRILLKSNYNDLYKFIAMYGLGLLFLVQTSINICVSLNLLPTKGMTLPFLSYGGSSMLGVGIIFGFVLIFTKRNLDFQSNIKKVCVIDQKEVDVVNNYKNHKNTTSIKLPN